MLKTKKIPVNPKQLIQITIASGSLMFLYKCISVRLHTLNASVLMYTHFLAMPYSYPLMCRKYIHTYV